MLRRRALFAALSVVALTFVGGSGVAVAQSEPGTIVEVASGNPDFSTLVKAVTEAKLAETLSGPGPFTVFAPTNAAFDALPAGTLDSLLKDPTGALANILKLHVISGAVDSKAAIAAAGGNVETLGGPVSVKLDGDKLIVGGATVVTADLKASTGIIHVIDAVITAPAPLRPPRSTPAPMALPRAPTTPVCCSPWPPVSLSWESVRRPSWLPATAARAEPRLHPMVE